MSGPGGNDVSMKIGADASDYTAGVNMAAKSTTDFAGAVASAAGSANSSLASMTAALNALTAQAKYLDQATQVLGADTAQQNLAWLTAQTGAKNYTDALTYLNAQLGFLKTQQTDFVPQAENVGSAIKTNLIGGFTGLAFSVNQSIQFLGNLKDIAAGAADMVLKIPSALASIPMNFLSSQLGIPTDPMQALNAGLDESWQLNTSTQKTRTGWGYIFGGGGQMGTGALAGQVVDPKGVAEQMMQWSSQESMRVPFTRQDLISAMTSLGLTNADSAGDHLTAAQVEQYMPYISDIASTYGSPAYGGKGVTLSQASQAIRATSMGLTRMLKYELNINPEDLIQYGLDATGSGVGMHINDPSTLLPALQAFAIARGISGGTNDSQGASMMMEQGTWQGAWSSFQDRVQNFLLQAGGTSLNGDVRQNSLLGNMQQELTGLTAWMDDPQHLATITKWADVIQNTLGGAVKTTTSAITGFFQGLQASGAGNTILDGLTKFGDWLNSPSTQATFSTAGSELGKVITPVAQTVAAGGQSFLQTLGNSGAGQALKSAADNFAAAFSDPKTKQDAIDFGGALGGIVGWLGKLAAFDFRVITDEIHNLGNAFGDVGTLWGDTWNGNFSNVPSDLGALKDDVGSFLTTSWSDFMQTIGVTTGPTPGTTANGAENTLPGNQTGKAGAPYGAGALPPNYTPSAGAALTKQANADAQAYVTAFHQQMASSNVGNTIASALSTSLTTGLNAQSNTFANALNTYVTAKVQEVVAAAMQGIATSTNAAARVPGGKTSPYAPGVS